MSTEEFSKEKEHAFLESIKSINTFLKHLRKCEKYEETIKTLELINDSRVKFLMNLLGCLHIVEEKNENINMMIDYLTFLIVVFTQGFYDQNFFSVDCLKDIKFCAENIYLVTYFLYSEEKVLVPYTECTQSLLDNKKSLYDEVISLSSEIELEVLLKTRKDLYSLLNEIVTAGNNFTPIREKY